MLDRKQYIRRLAMLLQDPDNAFLLVTYPQAEIDEARDLIAKSGLRTAEPEEPECSTLTQTSSPSQT